MSKGQDKKKETKKEAKKTDAEKRAEKKARKENPKYWFPKANLLRVGFEFYSPGW